MSPTRSQRKVMDYLSKAGLANEQSIGDAIYGAWGGTPRQRRAWVHPTLVALMNRGLVKREQLDRMWFYSCVMASSLDDERPDAAEIEATITGSTHLHPIGMGVFRSAAASPPGISFKPSTQVQGALMVTIDRETINASIARFREARSGRGLSITEQRSLMDEAMFYVSLFTPGTYRVPSPYPPTEEGS